MAKKSIGELNVSVTANAQQLLQEMKRADEATRAGVSRMDRELGKLQKSFSRKFSLGDVGKSVLSGLGIGSGFAVAQMVADKFVASWEKSAELAKSVEESTARQLGYLEGIIRLRQSDGERVGSIDTQLAAMQAQQAALLAGKEERRLVGGQMNSRWETVRVGPTAEQRLEAQKIGEEMQKLALEREQLSKKIKEEQVKTAAEGYALVEQLDAANADALRKTAQGLAADKRRILEEELSYQTELAQAELQATEARDKRLAEFTKNRLGRLNEEIFGQAEAALENVKPAMEQFRDEMDSLWNSVSDRAGQAFADMVLTGEASLGSLVEMVTRSILEITARMAIINPLLNAVFGGMSGWQALPAFGGFFADGGRPPVGRASVVGERGPELFVPDRPGTIIPNGGAVSSAPGLVYAPTYNVAAGVTRQELLPILNNRDRNLVGALADAQRRGAPLAAALG